LVVAKSLCPAKHYRFLFIGIVIATTKVKAFSVGVVKYLRLLLPTTLVNVLTKVLGLAVA
jgi:putative Ca2+/H+ antiporter (TMEM165/GDT1 family)